MKIIWLGHGSFRIECAGKVLLLDPWLTDSPVLPRDHHQAAIAGATHILLTHTHFDHVVDVLPLAKQLNIPVVGQYDLMGFWGGKRRDPDHRLQQGRHCGSGRAETGHGPGLAQLQLHHRRRAVRQRVGGGLYAHG